MARYFLHLRDGTDDALDPEGMECADMAALRKAVLAGARDVLGEELKRSGLLDFRYRIDAEDEAGNVVYSLPFAHAVSIIPDK
jgi:hypothetical protein